MKVKIKTPLLISILALVASLSYANPEPPAGTRPNSKQLQQFLHHFRFMTQARSGVNSTPNNNQDPNLHLPNQALDPNRFTNSDQWRSNQNKPPNNSGNPFAQPSQNPNIYGTPDASNNQNNNTNGTTSSGITY